MAKDLEMEMDEMPEVDNVGIMQGFLEMMNEDDDLEEDDGEMEAGEMLGRTPDSPEILMNNLRGDMRSIDARRDELADLVGYSAAAETPEPVLAMLQPVLAQQGIGAMVPPGMGLPPGAGMPPGPSPVSPVGAPNMPNVPNVPNMPSEMMTPMQPMPAGGIGDMAPPVQMAEGGLVGAARGLMGTANGMEDISAGTQMLESALGRIKTGNAGGGDFSSMGGGSPMAAGLRILPSYNSPVTDMVLQGGTPPVDATGMARLIPNMVNYDAPAVLPGNNPYGSTRSMFQPAAQGYNKGGIVQRFSQGGGTGADASEESDASSMVFPENIRQQAMADYMKLVSTQPTKISDLATLAGQREKTYRDILGSNQGDLAKLGFLTSLANRGFAYAANVDPATGQPLRGSQLSRFAGAARGLPEDLMKMAAAQRKEDQAIKMAGLESAEKQIAAEREANTKLIESQRKAFGEIIKSGGSPFGKGAWEWKIVNTPGLLARWSAKATDEDEDNLIESAINKLKERSMPRVETYTDAGGVKREITYPATPFPDFVSEAVKLRQQGPRKAGEPAAGGAAAGAPETRPTAQAPVGGAGEVTPSGTRIERPLAFKPEGQEMPAQVAAAPSMVPQPPEGMSRLTSFNPQFQGLYQMSSKIAGPGAWAASKISGVPGLGDPYPEVTQAMSNAQVAVEDLIEATLKSRSGAMNEQERLRSLYRIGPQFFKDPAAYQSELVALDNVLEGRLYRELKNANDKSLAEKDQLASREVVRQITNLRERFNVVPKVFSEEEALRYPGQTILWYGIRPMNVPATAPQGQ